MWVYLPDGSRKRVRKPRQYPWKGLAVNPRDDVPPAPGPWVDSHECLICRARYQDHRGDYSYDQAKERLKNHAKDEGDEGGGFRTRRAVLWALHVLKLESWYLKHATCGYLWQPSPMVWWQMYRQGDVPLELETDIDEAIIRLDILKRYLVKTHV